MENREKKDKNREYLRNLRSSDRRYVLFNNAKSRAKKLGLEFSICIDDVIIPEKCPIFGIPLNVGNKKTEEGSPSLDRKDSNRGYTVDNIWVISHKANRIKNNASIEELQLLSKSLEKFLPIKQESKISSSDGIIRNFLVIGENCNDRWIESKIRLSPEAPTLVLVPNKEISNDGMAANTCRNIENLSLNSKVCFISQSTGIYKTRYLDETSGYILVRIDENDTVTKSLTIQDFEENLKKTNLSYQDFDAVVISDYNKGFLTEEIIEYIARVFKNFNIPTFLDSKKILGNWSKDIFCVKINNKEYNHNIVNGVPNPEKFCQHLLVTKGKEGTYWVDKNKLIPTNKVQVANICGCGDTFHAALSVAYSETKDLLKSISFANSAAAYAASQKNVVAVQRKDLDKLI